MKRTRINRLLLMGAVPVVLTACEGEQPAKLFATAEECVADGSLTAQQCAAEFARATAEHERVAPRYTSLADCITDFGANQCVAHSSGNSFVPLMMGYMIGNAMSGNSRYSQPVYRDRTGEYRNAGGAGLGYGKGNVTVRESATKPQARAITQSRSGFGSSASARGNWGSG